MRRTAIVALVGCLALALVVAVASAHRTNIKSTVVLNEPVVLSEKTAVYSGDVEAREGGSTRRTARRARERQCSRGRVVMVFHKIPGKDFKIGTTFTGRRGTWKLTGPKPPTGDTVYAVVETKRIRPPKHKRGERRRGLHRCTGDSDSQISP